MACTPTPTQTVFSTGTYSTSSVSTTIFDSVNTITSTATITSTRCDVLNTTVGANPTCLSSTIITSTSLSEVVITNPITRLSTVPVLVPQTNPIQTLYSPCPDGPTTPTTPTTPIPPPPPPDSSTTSQQSTIIRTEFSTYTDSNGVHTSTTISSATIGSPNGGGGGSGKSGPGLGPIIGGVVGGLVGLLALCALVWFLLWRREQVKYLFDDDDDDFHGAAGVGAGGLKGNRPTALLAARGGHNGGRRGSRNLNLDDEIKGADAHPYQYGLVGGSPSPNGTPSLGSAGAGGAYQSQPSTMGYGHQRNSSRDALMTAHSPPVSPRHLDVPLPAGQYGGGSGGQRQRRVSQYTGSSGVTTDTNVMANQPPVGMANPAHNSVGGVGGRVSDERDGPWMGHHPRPSSSLLEAPVSYPPGHGGFYQQYGPLDQAQPAQQQQQQQNQGTGMQPQGMQGGGGAIHKPPLEQSLANSTRPIPAHQALYAAAGLGSVDPYASMTQPYSPLTSSTTTTSAASRTQSQGMGQMLASPPPGAGGARRYPSSAGVGSSANRQSDIFSAVMASGDAAAAAAAASTSNRSTSIPDVGFGRQRKSGEKSPEPRVDGARSPVIQHQDGGRISDVSGAPAGARVTTTGSGANTVDGHGGDAPPPAYSDP